MNIYTENLKTRRNFIARRDFRRCTIEQKTSLSHTFFIYFYVIHFPINFSFVTSYTEGILPNPRTSRNQRTPSLIQGISKMYGPYSMYIFYEIRKFSAFLKKAYDKRWCTYYSQLFKLQTRRFP